MTNCQAVFVGLVAGWLAINPVSGAEQAPAKRKVSSPAAASKPPLRSVLPEDDVGPSRPTLPPAEEALAPPYAPEPAGLKRPAAAATIPAAVVKSESATPAATTSATPAAPLSRQRRERRQKWEAALQSPANLTLDETATITLGELLARIREQHGLAVRIDLPHVLPMAAMADITTVQLIPNASRTSGTASTLPPATMPYSLTPSYTSSPAAIEAAVPQPTWKPGPATPAAPSPVLRSTYKPITEPVPAASPATADDPENARFSAVKAALTTDDSNDQPVAIEAKASPAETSDDESAEDGIAVRLQQTLNELLKTPVPAAILAQPEATVEDILRQTFDRSFPLQTLISVGLAEEGMPFGASLTRAMEWDLLVQDDGVLFTSRLNANLRKETRVYSVRNIEKAGNLKAEEIARVITRTVRPWSWRTHAPDTKAASPTLKKNTRSVRLDTLPLLSFDWMSLISERRIDRSLLRLTSDGAEVSDPNSVSNKVELTPEDLEMLAQMWDGLFQGTISSLQVIHHADPPTGVLEVLPGLLVISQSQGAHREIADLLEQLANPED